MAMQGSISIQLDLKLNSKTRQYLNENGPDTRRVKISEPERTQVRENYEIFTATQ